MEMKTENPLRETRKTPTSLAQITPRSHRLTLGYEAIWVFLSGWGSSRGKERCAVSVRKVVPETCGVGYRPY